MTQNTTDSKQGEAIRLCLAMGLPDNHACIKLAQAYLDSRASLAAVEGDAQSVNVRSECCNAEVRHRYCAKCGQECRIVSFPSLADAIAIVENCEYENVAVDVILQRLKALSMSER